MTTSTSSCLFDAPPTYEHQLQTPPVLLLNTANPPVTEVQILDTLSENPSLAIRVDLRSEDAGDRVFGIPFLDYQLPTQTPRLPLAQAPASTYDDTSRALSLSLTYADLAPGCRQLTLLATHANNFNFEKFTPVDPADVAIATWWLLIDDPTGSLGACPRPEAPP